MFELWNVVEPQNPVTCTPQADLSFRLPKQIWFFEMMPHSWGVWFCQGFTMFHRYLRFDGTRIFRSRMASVSFFPLWIRAKVPMWMGSSSGVSWGACKMSEMWPGSLGDQCPILINASEDVRWCKINRPEDSNLINEYVHIDSMSDRHLKERARPELWRSGATRTGCQSPGSRRKRVGRWRTWYGLVWIDMGCFLVVIFNV